jgi:hypothetical protein
MTPGPGLTATELAEVHRVLQMRADNFAKALREDGIHVGLGSEPRCVTCDQPWPCSSAGAS